MSNLSLHRTQTQGAFNKVNLIVFAVFMAELLGAVVHDDQQGSLTGEPLLSRAFEASTCSFCHSHRGERREANG